MSLKGSGTSEPPCPPSRTATRLVQAQNAGHDDDMPEGDDTDMTNEEFDAALARSQPVRVVRSRDEFISRVGQNYGTPMITEADRQRDTYIPAEKADRRVLASNAVIS